jgi:dipeptidyl aminopeptidase/acylaminoacyl peptidase
VIGFINVTGAFTADGWPNWSPDGKRFVFSRHVANRLQILVMDADGSNARRLTDAANKFAKARWSADIERFSAVIELAGQTWRFLTRRIGGIQASCFNHVSFGERDYVPCS